MEKNVNFIIDGIDFHGILKFRDGNKIELSCSLVDTKNTQYDVLKKLCDDGEIFKYNGLFSDKTPFTALKCNLQPSNGKTNYKIDIGTLYLNGYDIDKNLKINQADVKFSYHAPFAYETIYVKKHDCYLTFGETITIKTNNVITLEAMNNIIFELRILLEIFVLNREIEIIEKFVYTADNNKIEQVMKYDFEPDKDKKNVEYLIESSDEIDLEALLNKWFEAKERYGKIFSYLSGILNENSIVYMELKFFALAQWIEAYSRENFYTNKEKNAIENEREKKKKKLCKIIENIENIEDEDKIFLNENCVLKKEEDTFINNVSKLFEKQIPGDILTFDADLINDIKCYRNNLTHLNKDDTLNTKQMMYLYDILKNVIYILLMQELQITTVDKYTAVSKEIKRKYQKYKELRETIEKCKDK